MSTTTYAAPAASRLLDIVELLAAQQDGMSLSEISRRLDIALNSAFRICRVLEERDYLARDAQGALCLTEKWYLLGARLGCRLDLIAAADPWLTWLTQETGENAHLCVLRDDHLVLVAQRLSPHPLRVVVETGSLLHPHASAFGKAILAHLPATQQHALLAHDWPALTPATCTDPTTLATEWAEIRACGLATDREEYLTGVCCLGAPVWGAAGAVVAGVGIMGPAHRLTDAQLRAAEPRVRQAAAQISALLGGISSEDSLPEMEAPDVVPCHG
ncbi:MAG TPA: IclR family transcriptional regulator [Armatimonadota bacterium]|jgi:IclR family acetate operon transcriptional repressor